MGISNQAPVTFKIRGAVVVIDSSVWWQIFSIQFHIILMDLSCPPIPGHQPVHAQNQADNRPDTKTFVGTGFVFDIGIHGFIPPGKLRSAVFSTFRFIFTQAGMQTEFSVNSPERQICAGLSLFLKENSRTDCGLSRQIGCVVNCIEWVTSSE